MNPLIENLNLWGARLGNFAWPLAWQSGLLILVLFGLDFALRKRVRAAVRYPLWLVVLAKLVLPPTLALPTGIGWWVQPRKVMPPKPQPQFVVTYGTASAVPLPSVVESACTPPPPRLSGNGCLLFGWAGVGMALLGWLVWRWRQVACNVRQAERAAPWLDELVSTARQQAGLRREAKLRLTASPMSPAVCGLVCPVILLPRALVEQLPPAQLRAVLLHELVHLRRGDVWVNCLQALLQVVYWWHPLVWLANARIRRAREEAVDDAVMLVLRDEAEGYAPTLLEVAKLAFNRPLASLGLVGILESRSALRQRIERLVNFRPPRKAGLTLASALGVLFFAAVALPMEKAPAKIEPTNPIRSADLGTNWTLPTPIWNPDYWRQPTLTNAALLTRVFNVDTNSLYLAVRRRIDLGEPSGTAQFMTRLSQGIRMVFEDIGVDLQPPKTLYYGDRKGKLIVRATTAELDMIQIFLRELEISNVHSTGHGNERSNGIRPTGTNSLSTRIFKLDPNTFYQKLEELGLQAGVATNPADALRALLSAGVDLTPPAALFVNSQNGSLIVRATSPEMDLIQQLIEQLFQSPPQITLTPRFIEMPEQEYVDLWTRWTPKTNSASGGWSVVLTSAEERKLLNELEAKPNVDILTGPSVTTVSGRQAQIQIVDFKTIVTGLTNTVTNGSTNPVYQTQPMAFGPVLDVIPSVSADGYTIRMTSIPTLTEFLGYDDPRALGLGAATGQSNQFVLPLPHFRVRQTTISTAVRDGQTVVIGNALPVEIITKPNGTQTATPVTGKSLKRLIVLVTPTIIDPAGNRIHSDEDMPSAQDTIATQPLR